jgi:hypothetical protein
MNDVGTNLRAGANGFLQRLLQLPTGNFAHLLQDFIGSRQELRVAVGAGTCRGLRSGLLRVKARDGNNEDDKESNEAKCSPQCEVVRIHSLAE